MLGNSAAAVLALAGRWLAAPGDTDYEVLSGEVAREGSSSGARAGSSSTPRPTATASRQRDAFLAELKRRTRGAIIWEYPESAEAAAAKWEKTPRASWPRGKAS